MRRLQRRGLLSALIVCGVWSASAQTATHSATPPAIPAGYRIAGRVVDAVTGDPVRRATMGLLRQEDYRLTTAVVTDEDGHFAFESVPAGKYPLVGSKRGYRTTAYDEHDDYSSAIVTGAGMATDNLVFRLEPEAVLRGVVTGDGGDAVEHAQVMLFKHPADDALGERLEQAGSADTDDTGAYEISGLAAGEYLLAVKGAPWYAQHSPGLETSGQGRSTLDVAFPITYFDSTTDESAAKPITLAAGSREEADVNLHAVPALRFTITMPRMPRDTGARVMLQNKIFGNAENADQMTVTREDGVAEVIGVAPGSYQIDMGEPPRRMNLNATQSMDLDANAGTPGQSVSGSLVMAGGGPVPNLVNLGLGPENATAGMEAFPTTAHKGRFEISAVPPGTWSLTAGAPDGNGNEVLTVVSTATGDRATAGDKIVVGDRPVSVVVTVSKAQTSVKGFALKDGMPAPGVMVVLVPKEASAYPALARRDQSDLDGSFELRNVPAGQYTVVAIDDGWKTQWHKHEVIAKYLHGGIAITVPERAGPVVSLKQAVVVQTK